MNVLGLVGDVLKTAARVAGINIGGGADSGVLEAAAKVLERVKDTPEMRAALLPHEEKMKELAIAEMHTANEEALAMIASEDKYVARARPTGLYLLYGICSLLVIVQSVILILAAINNVKPQYFDLASIMPILLTLGGTGGLYVWKRTTEKMNGNGHGG